MSEIVFSGKESDKTISTIIKFWGTFTPQDRIELDDINNLKTYKDNLAILSNWLQKVLAPMPFKSVQLSVTTGERL